MNKLQLYICKSLRGFKSIRNINPSENIQRHIHDVRQALEIVSYDPAEKHLFYLISYIEGGAFFTILRTIPPAPLDHLATTIFIPGGLKISPEEFSSIVELTAGIVSNPSVSAEDLNELHSVFSKEYPFDAEAPVFAESEGTDYAFSFYGGSSGRALEDFFGDNLFQTGFLKYAGILLVDEAFGLHIDATDLTDVPLCAPAVLLPPEDADGFTPYLFGRVFDRPFRVSLGEAVGIVWKRSGFDDIHQTVDIVAQEQTVEKGTFESSRKSISPATFYITTRAGKKQIEDALITVNGTELRGEHSFSFDELKNAEVEVIAQGYIPYKATLNLAATSRALIQLTDMRRIYRFELPVKSTELGSPIRFEIHTKRQLTESPLEGYSLLDDIKEGNGRSNHLAYTGDGRTDTAKWIVAVAAALIVGFLLGWLIMSSGSSKGETPDVVTSDTVDIPVATATVAAPTASPAAKKETSAPKKETPVIKNEIPASKEDVAAAVKFLDANSRWTRADLDRHPALKGLFDDMNNFRLERIRDYWGPKLQKSEKFRKVAFHSGESIRKKIFTPQGTYCTAADNTITVQSYLNRIDPAKNNKK